jgi:hypothetical protein
MTDWINIVFIPLNQPLQNSGSILSSPSMVTALVALVLGLINIYIQWRDKQPSIEVKVSEHVDSVHSLSHDPERIISIIGTNKGQIPVEIIGYAFYLPNRTAFWLGEDYTSRVLPRSYCERWEYSDNIAESLKAEPFGFSGTIKLIALLRDSSGNMYWSKPFQFDIERASRGVKGQRIFSREDLGIPQWTALDRIKDNLRKVLGPKIIGP